MVPPDHFPHSPHPLSAGATVAHVRKRLPPEGLFDGKSWRIGTGLFSLSADEAAFLQNLGPVLLRFQRACLALYRGSVEGTGPDWLAAFLDNGKPDWLVKIGREQAFGGAEPRVIRPDLVWTADGPRITELDSVPGGIGLLAWLMEVYEECGFRPLGGSRLMREQASQVLGSGIIVSRESADYRPEMEWLARRLAADGFSQPVVKGPWELQESDFAGDWYRFFELFDWQQIEQFDQIRRAVAQGKMRFSPPWVTVFEEKLWLALYHVPQLRHQWQALLSEADLALLDELIPQGWLLQSTEAPPYAEIPGLGIHSWVEAEDFPQTARQLVVKISGFSERGWGSRSVTIGHDVPAEEWKSVLREALGEAERNPWIMQRFHSGRLVRQGWAGPDDGEEIMEGRARLCPYFFVTEGQTTLAGVLATVCPADKKILHGMTDAVLVPAGVRS